MTHRGWSRIAGRSGSDKGESMATQSGNATDAQTLQLYLLSIRGTLAHATLEAARAIHNQTAGAPESVAAARSLGDLSHMVYVPAGQTWRSMEGLNTFFANPHVQEEAGQIFRSRDPLVWAPADGFTSYHFPAPHGQNERFIGVVRGMVHTRTAAQEQHNAIVAAHVATARQRGNLSHEAYFRLAAPDAPEALEFLAIDVWASASGMQQHYTDPAFLQAFDGFFVAEAATSIWQHPAGEWVEW
jgi:quinol monooxygenase YgiN